MAREQPQEKPYRLRKECLLVIPSPSPVISKWSSVARHKGIRAWAKDRSRRAPVFLRCATFKDQVNLVVDRTKLHIYNRDKDAELYSDIHGFRTEPYHNNARVFHMSLTHGKT